MTSKILTSSREITLLSSKALRDLVEDTWQEYLGFSPQEEEIEGETLQGSNFLLRRAFLFLSTNHFHSHFIGKNMTWPSCTEVWEMSLTGQMYPNLNSIVMQERGGFWWKPRYLCQQMLDSFVSNVQALKFSFNK